MLTIAAIGFNRRLADPAQMALEGLSPAEIGPLVAERRVADAAGMSFLRFLLRRRPDVNALGPGKPSFSRAYTEATRTALGIARADGLADVERRLRRAGAPH